MSGGIARPRGAADNVRTATAAAIAAAAVLSIALVLIPEGLRAAVAIAAVGVGLVQPVAGVILVMAGSVALLFDDNPLVVVGVAGLVTVLLVFDSWRPGTRRQFRTPRLIAVFVGYLLLSWLVAASQSRYGFDAVAFMSLWGLQMSPMLLAFALTRTVQQLQILEWMMVGLACVVAVIQVATPVDPGTQLDVGSVGSALAANRNALGVFFLVALAVVLPRIRITLTPRDVGLLAVAVGLILATAASLSRSSYVAAAVLTLGYLLLRGWHLGAILIVAALILTPLLIGGDVNTLPQAISRLSGTFATGSFDPSSAARLDLWDAALKATVLNPIFGLGWQQFAPNLGALWEGSVSGLAIVSRAGDYGFAHNLYLTVLSQAGLVGAILLTIVAASCVRDAIGASDRHRETALLALAVVGAASLFGEPILVPAVSVPFLVTNALARMSQEADGSAT